MPDAATRTSTSPGPGSSTSISSSCASLGDTPDDDGLCAHRPASLLPSRCPGDSNDRLQRSYDTSDLRRMATFTSFQPHRLPASSDSARHSPRPGSSRPTATSTSRRTCSTACPAKLRDRAPEDAARRRRRRRLELRRRTAQAQLRHRGHRRAAADTTRSSRGCASTRSCPATTTARRTSHDMDRTASTSRSSTRTTRSSPTSSPTASSRSRACARTTTGCSTSSRARRPTTSSACRCCRSTTASTCASPSSTAASRRARGPGSSPASRSSRTTTPYYDPLYARAAEAGVPLTFHRTFGGKPSEADYDELVEQKITDRGHRVPLLRRGPAVHLHGDGRRVRPPSRRCEFVAAEVNCGWLPFWAQTMEQNLDIRAGLDDDDRRDRAVAHRACSGATSSSPCSTTTWASSSWRDYP